MCAVNLSTITYKVFFKSLKNKPVAGEKKKKKWNHKTLNIQEGSRKKGKNKQRSK